MNSLMADFFDSIHSMGRCTGPDHLRQALGDWPGRADAPAIRRALSKWLLDSTALDALSLAARETPTHYIWPLYVGQSGHSVFINEYKDPRHMGTGYAMTLHNHRYSFTAFILSGGYTQVRCDVHMLNAGQAARVDEIGADTLTEGAMVTVSHDAFHRLMDIGEKTMTLLVKCPAVKTYSISVDVQTLRITKHVPVETRVLQLINALAADVGGQAKGSKHARLA